MEEIPNVIYSKYPLFTEFAIKQEIQPETMLKNSFIFLNNVGEKRERSIWSNGIEDWETFMSANSVKGISKAKKEHHDWALNEANAKLRQDDARYFARLFPFSEQWRLYEQFKDEAVYLDIETDGYYGSVTVIGLYDGYDTKTMVRGFNLDRGKFESEMAKYKMIVTFNGASFDLPVLKRYFSFIPRVLHVDLRFVCQKIGLTGGLKAIERRLGIKRAEEVAELTGEDAVCLWNAWRDTGKREILDRLVMYNEEDVINLKPLAKFAVKELWGRVRTHIHPSYDLFSQ